ncbi:antibiotic biosynthesis monooxygenase [Ectobacillus sp. JY-23]|uniref:putative quinol monooxygenase n=1 Tax=Ectobacillus sp. JY-23 TaxID=2933872 RepID=UPI001FF60F70|nr:putative quinol monooxygenase [Ectobacillus sp. JY-23]UOY91278.1 antibiotic biosynthesis monooxygenase [Ectobacillus sp. JY-23]
MIIIHATLTIDATKEALFLQEITPLLEASRAEEGNISYTLTKNAQKENEFIMVEAWKDLRAVSAHNTSAHFTTFSESAKDFVIAPIELKMYEASTLK